MQDRRYLPCVNDDGFKCIFMFNHIVSIIQSDSGSYIETDDGKRHHVKNDFKDLMDRYTNICIGRV